MENKAHFGPFIFYGFICHGLCSISGTHYFLASSVDLMLTTSPYVLVTILLIIIANLHFVCSFVLIPNGGVFY